MAQVAERQSLRLLEASAKARVFKKHGLLTASARTLMNWLYFLALFLLLPGSLKADNYEPFDYKSGFTTIQTLGSDIYSSLTPAEKSVLSPQPISLDTSRKPFVRLLHYCDGAETIRGVWVSQGFIDLVNQLAHARAIDKKQKGYFASYLKLLENAGGTVPPLPNRNNPVFWTDALLNEQFSNFNSIMGIVVAINLAEHYLGLYEKYQKHISSDDDEPTPLHRLLTPDEWTRSYRHGLNNAMLASCMTEGFLPICDGLSNMKQRPAWAVYFYPDTIKFDAMRKDIVKLQRRFLME